MGTHIYIYDKYGKEISCPSVRVPVEYERTLYDTQLEAHRFIARIRVALSCTELSCEEEREILLKHWRNETVSLTSFNAINLAWIVDIINTPEFGYLRCG